MLGKQLNYANEYAVILSATKQIPFDILCEHSISLIEKPKWIRTTSKQKNSLQEFRIWVMIQKQQILDV